MSEVHLYNPPHAEKVGLAAPIVNSHFDVMNLYNAHGTIADAQQSAAYIEPDSIVFLEGAHFEFNPLQDRLESRIGRQSSRRLEVGKTDGQYNVDKNLLLFDLDQELAHIPAHDPTFRGFFYAIRRELLAKDCAVFVADADLSVLTKDQQKDGLLDFYRRHPTVITDDIFLGPGRPLDRMRDSQVRYHEYTRKHHNREKASIILTSIKLQQAALQGPMAADLSMTELHKRRVYTLWGTYHAASMTGEFLRHGFDVRQKVIDQEADTGYFIQKHDADGRKAARRRIIADAAAIAIDFTGYRLNPDYNMGELSGYLTDENIKGSLPKYLRLDRLVQAMRDLQVEYRTAMQYSVPRPDIDLALEVEVLNVWNLLQELGIPPEQYLEHPLQKYFLKEAD